MELTTKDSSEIDIKSETSISEESTKESEINITENNDNLANQVAVQNNEINKIEDKEYTNENINLEDSTSSAHTHLVTVDINPEISILERSGEDNNESIVLTPYPQYRHKRSTRRRGLPPINEDIIVSIGSDPQPSTSGLNNRLERMRGDDIYDSSDDSSSFADSLYGLNEPFLLGVWNGPAHLNPVLILLLILVIMFCFLMGGYIHSLKPVYA